MYWMNETTGEMARIVNNYFKDIALDEEDLNMLKKYIIQWIDRIPFEEKPTNYKVVIEGLSQEDLSFYIMNTLVPKGIDPF